MGWVTPASQMPGSPREGEIESPINTNIWNLWQKEVSAHRGGEKGRSEKAEWNGQLEIRFQGDKWTVCVQRERCSLFTSTLDIYPKSTEQTKKEASHQWKKYLFTLKPGFKAPVPHPASSRDLPKEDLTEGWPWGQMALSGCSLCPIKWATGAEGGCAHPTFKKLPKYHWKFLNLLSRASEQKTPRN